jgi:shikimate kinase
MLIFLIGFMGCGKSYIGRKIAPNLGYEYIDMDKFIETQQAMSIKQIFDEKGESYFRNLEHEFLLNIDSSQNLVISTGGGVPCFFNNIQIMNEKGLTIYLNRNKELVLSRLKKGIDKRPLLQNLNEEELSQFYDQKLADRKQYYEQAKIFAHNADYLEIIKMIEGYKKQLS